jgi:hypothetical protein
VNGSISVSFENAIIACNSNQTKKSNRKSKFSGNFGDVYLGHDALVFEFQTSEIGGMIYREVISQCTLDDLNSGKISEGDLVKSFTS